MGLTVNVVLLSGLLSFSKTTPSNRGEGWKCGSPQTLGRACQRRREQKEEPATLLLHVCGHMSCYMDVPRPPGCESEKAQSEEDEGGTLTAWGLIVLVIWEKVVQSLFAGVGVFLLLRKRRDAVRQ